MQLQMKDLFCAATGRNRPIPAGIVCITWCVIVLALSVAGAAAQGRGPKDGPFKDNPNSIFYVDSVGAVLECGPSNGAITILSQGPLLTRPYAITLLKDKDLVVSDTGIAALVRVNVSNGAQSVLASGPELGTPYGIAADDDGQVYVANGRSIVAVHAPNGKLRSVSSGGLLRAPLGVSLGTQNRLFVADAVGAIIQINSKTGTQRLVSRGGYLVSPVATLFYQEQLFVTEMAGRKILWISPETGQQRIIAEGGFLTTPVGMALFDSNTLCIGDPDCNNFTGALISIDLTDGSQKCMFNGFGDFVNPRGIAIVQGGLGR
jgi:hypothetical protein